MTYGTTSRALLPRSGAIAVVIMVLACAWRSLSTSAESGAAHVLEGDALQEAGRAAEAAQEYKLALGFGALRSPEVVQYNMALALRETGELTLALAAFNDTLMQLARNDQRAHGVLLQIAELAAELGAWELASLHWRAAAALQPRDLAALSNAASALLNAQTLESLVNAVALLRRLVDRLEGQHVPGAAGRASRTVVDGASSARAPSLVHARARLGVALVLSGVPGAAEEEASALLTDLADHVTALADHVEQGDGEDPVRAALYAAFAVEERRPEISRTLLRSCVGADVTLLGEQATSAYYR